MLFRALRGPTRSSRGQLLTDKGVTRIPGRGATRPNQRGLDGTSGRGPAPRPRPLNPLYLPISRLHLGGSAPGWRCRRGLTSSGVVKTTLGNPRETSAGGPGAPLPSPERVPSPAPRRVGGAWVRPRARKTGPEFRRHLPCGANCSHCSIWEQA